MKIQMPEWNALFGLLAVMVVFSGGCGQATNDDGSESAADVSHEQAETQDHSGWWCVEHSIPEEECSMCSVTAAEDFKSKGDWCDEHNRAESQCFLCDPSRAEKFTALYEAKYGEKPPKATE